jgi:serine/threonine protein phosphatase PrpC
MQHPTPVYGSVPLCQRIQPETLFQDAQTEVVDMIAKGKLKRFIDLRYKVDEWDRTQSALEKRAAKGKADAQAKLATATDKVAAQKELDEAEKLSKLVDVSSHDLENDFMLSPEFMHQDLDLVSLAYPPRRDTAKTLLHRSRVGTFACHGVDHEHYKLNQDRGLVAYPFRGDLENSLFIVADGHGPDGHHVADFVIRDLAERLAASASVDTEPEKAIIKAFTATDDALAVVAKQEEVIGVRKGKGKNKKQSEKITWVADPVKDEARKKNMAKQITRTNSANIATLAAQRVTEKFDAQRSGCTVVAALLQGSDLWCAVTGDCRAVLCSRKPMVQAQPNIPKAISELREASSTAASAAPAVARNTDTDSSGDDEPKEVAPRAAQRRMSRRPSLYARPQVSGVALTVDQTVTNDDEVARVEEAGGVVEPPPGLMQVRLWFNSDCKGPGLQPLRTFGDHAARRIGVIPTPIVTKHKIQETDLFIILASDGVWEYITDQMAAESVFAYLAKWNSHPRKAELASQALIRMAMKFWKNDSPDYRDDISCTVVLLPPQDHDQPSEPAVG